MKTLLKNIESRRRLRLAAFRNNLKNEAFRLSQLLLDSGFKFKRLYLFGSLVKKDKPLSVCSDIDLVIEGLHPDFYYKAYALLLKNAKFKIDLKPFEELDQIFKRRVKDKGVVIYEAR